MKKSKPKPKPPNSFKKGIEIQDVVQVFNSEVMKGLIKGLIKEKGHKPKGH